MKNSSFSPEQRAVLALLCGADLMVVLDFSIVNVALPSIQTALGFTPQGLQWLLTGYGLVFGGFMMLGGRLADLYGRKRIFFFGTILFTLASLLGGFSKTPEMLVAMRCLQGLGAAFLAPAALALLMGVFPEGPSRNRAFGIWGTVAAAGYSIGVVLGGLITAKLGWRWILFVNVPLGLVIIMAAFRIIKESSQTSSKRSLDILGSFLITSGLMALVYGLVQASIIGWTNWLTWRNLGIASFLLALFIWVEAKSKEPLLPLGIFLLPGIAAANIISTLVSAAMIAMNLFLTLYFQGVLGYSPFYTGLAFLPHGFAAIIAGPLGGILANKMGAKRVLLLGLVIVIVCLISLTCISTQDTFWVHILPTTILISLGIMPAFITLTILATNGVKEEDHGLVSGILNTTGQLGGALGLAVLCSIAATHSASLDLININSKTENLVAGFRWGLATAAGFTVLALALGWFGIKKDQPSINPS